MTQIVVDEELREKLLQLNAAEFVDDHGMVLGSFFSSRPQEYEPGVIPPISDEEQRRLLASPGRHSTEEVLAYLRSL